MSDLVELKPCPFCGGSASIERYGDRRQSTIYQCDNCSCSLETGEEWGHGQDWNRRADLRSEVTRLQKELETAREDALEEAAALFDARNDTITELMEREYHQVVKDSCISAILRNATDAAAIRNLKDKEVAE